MLNAIIELLVPYYTCNAHQRVAVGTYRTNINNQHQNPPRVYPQIQI
jgi:hypothetical protein